MAHNPKRWLLPACASALALGCKGSSDNPQNLDAAIPDADIEPIPDGGLGIDLGSSIESGTGRTLSGAVTDQAGAPVVGAKVVSGTSSVFSNGQGLYTLAAVGSGSIVVVVTRDWFEPFQVEVDVNESGTTRFDIVLQEMPLTLDPADVALANAYNLTFDWSRQKLSIAISAMATRRNFDSAVYWKNPALSCTGRPATRPTA